MKNERVFKSFSALSIDGKAVTGANAVARSDSQAWLTPESVQEFDVEQDGAADGDWPQPERSGATRHWPRRRTLPVEFRQTRRRWLVLPISRGCAGAE